MIENCSDGWYTRRDALRLCGTALAAGVAGCSGLPPLGTRVRYGSVDAPAADGPSFRDWLPVPTAFPEETAEYDSYDVWAHVPPPADAPAWASRSLGRELVVADSDYLGVHVDDVDVAFTTAMGGGVTAVLVGDVDREAVRDAVETTSYERDGSVAGAPAYSHAVLDRSVAVRPDGLVFGNGPNARGVLEAVVDAVSGEQVRYHERDEDFATLTDAAGTRRWTWFWPDGASAGGTADGLLADTVGLATGFDHDDAGVYFVGTWVFPADYDLTEGRVENALKTEGPALLPDATEVSASAVTVDGRIATIAMYLAPDVAREMLSDTGAKAPHVTWGATHDSGADRLTFHHEAGDPVRTDWLRIRRGDRDRTTVDAGAAGDRIEPGESLTVSTAGIDPGTTVRLQVEPPDTTPSLLIEYELP